MTKGCVLLAGLLSGFTAAASSVACGGAEQPAANGVQYQPAATPPVQAGAPVPEAPVVTPAPVTPAAPVAPPMAAAAAGSLATPPVTPPMAGENESSSPRGDAASPRRSPPTAAAAGSAAGAAGAGASDTPAAGGAFDAGAGAMQSDGKTIVYRIPDGTGGKDWNSKSEPIRAKRGMTVRLIDDDKSTKSGGHWLHTYGQPCPHSARAIGMGYDCVISQKAPLGIVSGVAEHNIGNGIGHLYIEVVEN